MFARTEKGSDLDRGRFGNAHRPFTEELTKRRPPSFTPATTPYTPGSSFLSVRTIFVYACEIVATPSGLPELLTSCPTLRSHGDIGIDG